MPVIGPTPSGPQGPKGDQGDPGLTGPQGPPGQGVAPGGTTGQDLRKTSATDYAATWQSGLPFAALPAPSGDLNLATAPGFYFAPTTATNTPLAGRAYHVWTYAAADTPSNVVQVAHRATAALTPTSIEGWQRTGSGGSWSPWLFFAGVRPYTSYQGNGVNQTLATSSTFYTFTSWTAASGTVGITVGSAQWTMQQRGMYQIMGQIGWPPVASPTGQRVVRVMLNGTSIQEVAVRADAGFNTAAQFNIIRALEVGDVVLISVMQSQGASSTVLGTANLSFINIQQVGDSA